MDGLCSLPGIDLTKSGTPLPGKRATVGTAETLGTRFGIGVHVAYDEIDVSCLRKENQH